MQREGLDTRMSKIAIVTDSNSGITQAEGARRGIHVLPMPFMIDEVTYYEDIDLTQEQFYEKLKSGANIATSQPSPDSVTSLWDKLLQEYDEIVHIPMSSGLSGSCQSAMAFAADYDGRVQVVNNQRISVTQRQSALDALQLAAAGKDAAQIKEFLENDKFNSSIYIMLDTLYYLKKGGRITPAPAALGLAEIERGGPTGIQTVLPGGLWPTGSGQRTGAVPDLCGRQRGGRAEKKRPDPVYGGWRGPG